MNLKHLWAAGVCLAFLPSLAYAQGSPVYQSGAMSAAHVLAKITRNGQIQDASPAGVLGDVNGRGVNPFAVTDSLAVGVCSNTAVTSGAYNALCFGHDSSGNGLFTLDSYGGLGNKTVYLRKNGTLYEFPFTLSGAVGPVSTVVNDIACWNNTSGTLLADCSIGAFPAQVATNAALIATSTVTYPNGVWRLDYSAAFGAPPQFYRPSGSACTLNSGGGDNGSEVLSANGKCWVAALGPVLDQRVWGLSEATGSNFVTVHVALTGVDAGYCFSAHPCRSGAYALAQGLKFDTGSGALRVKYDDAGPYADSLAIQGPGRGVANTSAQPNIGTVWPGMVVVSGPSIGTPVVLNGDSNVCYTLAASGGAALGVQNVTVNTSTTGCESGIFGQYGGIIHIFGGVTCGTVKVGCFSIEDTGTSVQIWERCEIKMGASPFRWAFIGAGAEMAIAAGGCVPSGTNVFSGEFLQVQAGHFHTNIANPFGASPAVTAVPYWLLANASIDLGGNAVAWPGASASQSGILSSNSVISNSAIAGCVGGAASCPNATAPTGLGAGGTVTLDSYSSVRSGSVILTAGAGAASTGAFYLSFPALLATVAGGSALPGACSLNPTNVGTGALATASVLVGGDIGANPTAAIAFNWTNGGATALTNGLTYKLRYTCGAGDG